MNFWKRLLFGGAIGAEAGARSRAETLGPRAGGLIAGFLRRAESISDGGAEQS